MADEIAALIKERDAAAAHLEQVKEELAKYESPEELEQRDLARQEYEHQYLGTLSVEIEFWRPVAALAEPNGEAWLFEAEVMQRDRQLAKKHVSSKEQQQ